ncbi:DUF4225 domain-containing protein [Salmonella enterica]|nr:DUF4225 domain-containing protein [Salmonella enterica subsp. houtenae]EJJ0114149.1 DUF4225 domain-containing protein [Salmonella enterica]ECI4804751.1 hypothetical protein [Salmonella enterica subsp. houtenae]EJJ0162602.1 DUF4225 domain-containing protein [Salmonella enterica]EJJ0289091.1 DUF4225 domain-containing protein [Salmonella enterica]
MSSYGLMSLQREKEKIDQLVFDIGFQYLHDPAMRSKYMIEERRVTSRYLDEYRYGKLDFGRSIDRLREYHMSLTKYHMQLRMGSIKLYAIAQKERNSTSLTTLSLKGVGFASGLFQILGGIGFCVKDIRSACGKFGVPLIIQGGENSYENGCYLFTHKEPTDIPIRHAYRYIAKLLGGDDKTGDIAFSSVDIALSVGSLGSLTHIDGARKLFYSIREDFIRGWRAMGVAGIGTELVGDASSGFSIYQVVSQPETNWSELKD